MTDARVRVDLPRPDRRSEINVQVTRLSGHLTALEAAARSALPQSTHSFGWAAFSMDTGLTEAQEDFVTRWSPAAVLAQCRAQRRLIEVVGSWLQRHPGPDDLDLALILLCAFSDALGE